MGNRLPSLSQCAVRAPATPLKPATDHDNERTTVSMTPRPAPADAGINWCSTCCPSLFQHALSSAQLDVLVTACTCTGAVYSPHPATHPPEDFMRQGWDCVARSTSLAAAYPDCLKLLYGTPTSSSRLQSGQIACPCSVTQLSSGN